MIDLLKIAFSANYSVKIFYVTGEVLKNSRSLGPFSVFGNILLLFYTILRQCILFLGFLWNVNAVLGIV